MYRLSLIFAVLAALSGCYATAQVQAASEPLALNCSGPKEQDQILVGKTEQEAKILLQGCRWRITERDGQSLPATMDYVTERRNLGVKNGKVIWVRRG